MKYLLGLVAHGITPTRQTNTKYITTSHTLQFTAIDDRHTVSCPRYDDTILNLKALFLRSKYYDIIITLYSCGHGCAD
jgi:hypothetical protein